jgi:8-hydroxy-5-deazaflavin:NADPH oxidoreductase
LIRHLKLISMYTNKTKIGIIGSADVGRALATGFLKEGNPVMLGTRDPSKGAVQEFKKQHANLNVGTFADTASFGEILVLCVKGTAAESAVSMASEKNFENKVVVDATNPISEEPPTDGVLHYFLSSNESLLEKLQAKIPAAHFVKAFNSVGSDLMYKPSFKEGKPTMFYCGDYDDAKQTVKRILEVFGWETCDVGKAIGARTIEPLAMLWCVPGFLRNEWTHAFKLLKQE